MPIYEPNITAVLCVDLYNDFLSKGGKLFPWIKDIAEEVGAIDNLRKVVAAAREAGITIFHVPHHRMEPGCYHDWKYPAPYQLLASENQVFAKDSWGGTFHPDFQVQPGDVVCTEHWSSSGFPNTDLDHLLKRHDRSSASASWPTLASRRQREPDRNLVTTSLWSVMQLRLASLRRCTPH